AADVARAGVGPGAAFVVGGAGGLAGLIALMTFDVEIAVVAAEAVDRRLDGPGRLLDHAGAAHAGDAATVLGARRDVTLQPAHRAAGGIGRIVETPGPATPVALAGQCAIRRIAGAHQRVGVVAARTVEIGLRLCLAGRAGSRSNDERCQTRPDETAFPHRNGFQTTVWPPFDRRLPVPSMNSCSGPRNGLI